MMEGSFKRLLMRGTASRIKTFGQLSVSPALWAEARNGVFQEATGTPATPSAVGDVVGSLVDLSGNSRTLQSGTTAKRGILRARAGGRAIEMDGTDDNYRAVFTLGQPFTRVTCLTQITWTINDQLLDGGTNSTYYVYQSGTSPAFTSRSGAVLLNLTAPLGTPFVLTEVCNGASTQARVNKGSWVTGNFAALAAGGVSIGARGDGLGSFANIDFYGNAIYASASLSADELDRAAEYAASLAGITI